MCRGIVDTAARHEEKRKTTDKDVEKDDMQRVGVTEQDASDIVRQWRQMIECGNPKKEQPKEQDD